MKEHLEIINHREAIEYIEELVCNIDELSEYNIKAIHALILKGIDLENAGTYRSENVFISGAKNIPPSYINVSLEMQQLISRYQTWKVLHPVARACFLHGEFVKIHPFIDGNGRTTFDEF